MKQHNNRTLSDLISLVLGAVLALVVLAGCGSETPQPVAKAPVDHPSAPDVAPAVTPQPERVDEAPSPPPISEPPKPAVPAAVSFPLEFQIVDPDNPQNAALKPGEDPLPPLFVMFPEGKTAAGVDARGPIGRLEGFRGASKLLPKTNDDPGLPVLLAGLRFTEQRDTDNQTTGYEVELQGEFNAVKVVAPMEAMKKFLAGERATFALESKLNYGIIATNSTTRLEMALVGEEILIYSAEGEFSFRELLSTYESAPYKSSLPAGRTFLYRGQKAKLPQKPILSGV